VKALQPSRIEQKARAKFIHYQAKLTLNQYLIDLKIDRLFARLSLHGVHCHGDALVMLEAQLDVSLLLLLIDETFGLGPGVREHKKDRREKMEKMENA
jgi:hypothetical protein